MNFSDGIAARLRRVRAGATQAAFAERLGVDIRTVKRWEAGSLLPNGTSLLNLMLSYGIDANWLLSGKGADPDSSVSASERRIISALREKGENATSAVFAILGLERYLVERQDHTGEWREFVSTDDLDEAQAKAGEGFRRVVDLYTGRVVFGEGEGPLY